MNTRMLILAAVLTSPLPAQMEEAPVPSINTQVRQAVVDAYRLYYADSAAVPWAGTSEPVGWTGSVNPPVIGNISPSFRNRTLRRINWYRALAGLGNVRFDANLNQKAQAGALMVSAAEAFPPYPPTTIPTSWPAYSPQGAEGCQNSVLALNVAGPAAVDLLVHDGDLPSVGHRVQLLLPPQTRMGSGSVPRSEGSVAADLVWTFEPVADWTTPVAWPNAGYHPIQAINGSVRNWSFTAGFLDFQAATVTVTKNTAQIPASIIYRYPTGTIFGHGVVWSLPGDTARAGDVYQVTIGNVLDQGFPRNFSYTVKPIDPEAGKLINVSTRLRVETGDNVGIAGFVVSGDGSRRVVIRAMGPSLTGFGVAGALSNPTLEVRDATGRLIASNDDWQTGPQLGEAGSTDGRGVVREVINVGDTPFAPSNPREAAIALALMPGQYTAIVRGVAGENGIALAEVFDLDAADINSRAVNVSTRGKVGQGDAVMIGGFVVRGTTSTVPVVVRAMGPSLTALGVQGALQDPMLELRDSAGQVVATCDDVRAGDQPALGTLFPTDSREAAVRVDLAPGSYTAIVRGKNGMTGVALVEAYEVK